MSAEPRLKSNVEPHRGSKSSQRDGSWQVRRGLKVWFTQDTFETLADPEPKARKRGCRHRGAHLLREGSENCQARTWLWPWIWWDLFYMMVCLNPQKVGWIVQSVRGPTMCSGVWVWIPKDTICIQTLRLSASEPAQILLVVRGIN